MDENGFVNTLLSQKSEHARVKFLLKYDAEFVLKNICAFLNNDGGWIIVGLSDAGERVPVDVRNVADDIKKHVVREIRPLPLVYIHEEKYLDSEVVLVTVMKGGLPPYSYKTKYYTIKEKQAIQPDKDEVNLLVRHSMSLSSSWEKSICVDAEWEDLSLEIMNRVVSEGVMSGRLDVRFDTPEKLLGHLQLLDSPYVKNGAMALFGSEVTSFLPQCKMRIQVMLGGKTSDKFEDTIIMEGNLLELSKQANEYFRNRLPVVSAFHHDDWTRTDYSEYPQEVLDEAITNALIHRDMSDRTDEVLVFIYADRMEVINSGIMPDNIVRKKNVVQSHMSFLRNPLMAEIFYLSGKMEKTGRGLQLIHDRMFELKRKLPEWECSGGKTKLTIYRRPIDVKLNERTVHFLTSIDVGDTFSRKDYLKYWNYSISDRTAKNDLQLMVSNGLCRKEGAGPTTRYVVLGNSAR